MTTAFEHAVNYNRLNELAQEMLRERELPKYDALVNAMELIRKTAIAEHGADEFYDELEDLQ